MPPLYRLNTIHMNALRTFSQLFAHIYSQILRTPSTICVATILISSWISGNQNIHSTARSSAFYLIIPLVGWAHSAMTSQRMLSDMHDGNRERLDYRQSLLLPFLPEKGHVSTDEWNKIGEELKSIRERRQDDEHRRVEPSSGWALVTGASRGIGRAISIELARWNVPVILVARDVSKLTEVSNHIEEFYGVATKIIVSDFTTEGAVEKLFETSSKMGNEIDILVHNAGIADTVDLTEIELSSIENMIQTNVLAGTKLLRLYGKDMKDRLRGRIVVISSISGAVPGVASSSVYAGTKAYQRVLAASMGQELEPYGVGVTLVMPGAVKNTEFSKRANMEDAFIWKLNIGTLTPEIVATATVRSMLIGNPEVIVGWINVLFLMMKDLIPARLTMLITSLAFSQLDFPFFRKEGGTDEKKELLDL